MNSVSLTIESELPSTSQLVGMASHAFYQDSYSVPINQVGLSLSELYLGIFAHVPWYGKILLTFRNKLFLLLGLHASSAAEIWKPQIKSGYCVGDKIVRFIIYALNETEIVTGMDEKHLDFRVSVLRLAEGDGEKIVVSTVVLTHNLLGRVYMSAIKPFHRFGVKKILRNAAKGKRI